MKWSVNERDPASSAAMEIGDVCLYVSRISDCLHGRWVWTGDVDDPADPRAAIHGIARSRAEAMKAAVAAARRLRTGTLSVAGPKSSRVYTRQTAETAAHGA